MTWNLTNGWRVALLLVGLTLLLLTAALALGDPRATTTPPGPGQAAASAAAGEPFHDLLGERDRLLAESAELRRELAETQARLTAETRTNTLLREDLQRAGAALKTPAPPPK